MADSALSSFLDRAKARKSRAEKAISEDPTHLREEHSWPDLKSTMLPKILSIRLLCFDIIISASTFSTNPIDISLPGRRGPPHRPTFLTRPTVFLMNQLTRRHKSHQCQDFMTIKNWSFACFEHTVLSICTALKQNNPIALPSAPYRLEEKGNPEDCEKKASQSGTQHPGSIWANLALHHNAWPVPGTAWMGRPLHRRVFPMERRASRVVAQLAVATLWVATFTVSECFLGWEQSLPPLPLLWLGCQSTTNHSSREMSWVEIPRHTEHPSEPFQ